MSFWQTPSFGTENTGKVQKEEKGQITFSTFRKPYLSNDTRFLVLETENPVP